MLLGCGGTTSGGGGEGADGTAGAGGEGGSAGAPSLEFDCNVEAPDNCPSTPPNTIDATRPAQVTVPEGYTVETRYPLVVVLHAAASTGTAAALYLGATDRLEAREFVLLTPNALPDVDGNLAWNTGATSPAFDGSAPDDLDYLRRLLEEAQRAYRIDAARVYLMGSSGGANLALDLVCAQPEVVAAVISQAGALPAESACSDDATALLSIHGTNDVSVPFGGGILFPNGVEVLSAVNLVSGFAQRTGCGAAQNLAGIDLVADLPGAETRVQAYESCPAGTAHELWAVQQAPNRPDFTEGARDLWFDWLFARMRTAP